MSSRFFKKRSHKKGLVPGSLVLVGEKKDYRVRITAFDYSETGFEEKEINAAEDCYPYKDKPSVTWINVDGIHDLDVVEKAGKCFDLDPLVLEDVLNTDHRPKVEDFDTYLFIVLKTLHWTGNKEQIQAEQISLVLGRNFLISFQESSNSVFEPVRERIRKGKGRIRRMGTDFLAYSLIDNVVDNYFGILEDLGDRIEDLEVELIEKPDERTLYRIYELKKEMIFLRKSVWPLREVIGSLERGDFDLVNDSTDVFFRDTYDHTIQVIETIETFRDILSGMLDMYLSSISNRLNSVMKVLTIIATIFIPLTFIAGLYGMNFHFMPELGWRWGYPFALSLMAAVALTMLIFFRRRKWL
jgi:magnesium transporter